MSKVSFTPASFLLFSITESISIYENYGKPGEKLIGQIDFEGNILASPVPFKWSEKALDEYIDSNDRKITQTHVDRAVFKLITEELDAQ